MENILGALADQHEELSGLVAGLSESGWRTPSACEGWSVCDVVLHLAQTDEMAVASLRGEFGEALSAFIEGMSGLGSADDGAGRIVERQRGAPGEEVLARWRAASGQVRDLLAVRDPHDRVDWVAGKLSAHTLATTRLAEAWIHTGDVARGLGVALDVPERIEHIARLAWRTLPYAFARAGRELAGPVALELRAPNGVTWTFAGDDPALTVVRGPALDLCLVAARRLAPSDTSLEAEGPDAQAVLELIRTFA